MATVTTEDIRHELARKSFADFLPFVQIIYKEAGDNRRGLGEDSAIPFEVWPHLQEMAALLPTTRYLLWPKARQIGASWVVAAYALWEASYFPGGTVIMFSQGEDEAKDLLAKCKFIYEHLPSELKITTGTYSTQVVSFPSNQSMIAAFPSTEKAGRSYTATLAIMDEADFHPNLETNYNAVKPTIDDNGGKLWLVSTINHETVDSHFRTLIEGSPRNLFTTKFYGWEARPGRDDEWMEDRKLQSTNQAKLEKEYPATLEEALRPPETVMAFEKEALDDIKVYCRPPISRDGYISMYHKFQKGRTYVAATDTAHGVGKDDAVTGIMDLNSGTIVADIKSSTIAADELAIESMKMLDMYENPLWAIEANDIGIAVIMRARDAMYPRLYFRERQVRPGQTPLPPRLQDMGWKTDERTRWMAWSDLQEAVKNRLITIPNVEGLQQFYTTVRNVDKSGRIEAARGAHDDYPMMVAIAWQMRKETSVHRRGVGRGKKGVTRKKSW